ncbi:MAG: TonB-dependent receptor plug domain-containing protein, partial [Burkholderiales bacterium]|nr:TonB-dependent receptor plug domain-containing protein [Burkholderiales bacterium]
MAHTTYSPNSFARTALTQALTLCALATHATAWAQPTTSSLNADAPTLGTVTVSTRTAPVTSGVAGFGDEDLVRTPVAVKVIDAQTLSDRHVRRMSEVLQFDASATDAYNAVGYWDYVTLRGFVLDARYNFRRDGMPISAETALSLENRERIELLKGTSGIQAGTSAPGGLVNHVIKRPTEQPLRTVKLEANQHGNVLAHVDLGGRLGVDNAVGYRLNVAAENMKNHVPGAGGHRELFALAMDWRVRPGSLLEVDLEHSRRSQPSVPGLSLTGNTLPAANPFANINNQPWSQPGVMSGLTGGVRYEQAINADWSWQAQASRQSLKANDFLAYPYGCYAAATDTYYADRYCPNGDFDLYDYRSLNERRVAESVQWQ